MTSIKDNRHPFKFIFLIQVHVLVQSNKSEYVLRPPPDLCDWYKQGIKYLPFLLISENSFDQLVGKFQKSLQHHYESSNAVPLYDPGQMKKFADKSAPGLFNVIFAVYSPGRSKIEWRTPCITGKKNRCFVAHNSIFQVLCPVYSLSI